MKTIFTGALIGDEHTLRDWGAIITNSDCIGMPEPNTVLLEVPGRSGRLDLSEVLTGDVTYSNREIKLELAAQTNSEKWGETCFHIFNKFHRGSRPLLCREMLDHRSEASGNGWDDDSQGGCGALPV